MTTFPGSEMECNPIVVDGVLLCHHAVRLRVIALDAAIGLRLVLELILSPRPGPGVAIVV